MRFGYIIRKKISIKRTYVSSCSRWFHGSGVYLLFLSKYTVNTKRVSKWQKSYGICVLVVKPTTTKHFGILGHARITKKNVRPHTSCMGGGGRRAPPPDARENHVIR